MTPMENNAKVKKIWGAFVLIFFSGLLLGGVIGFYIGKPPARKSANSQSFRQHIFDNYVNELALTPEQQQKIRPVVDKGFDRIQDFRLKRSGELIEIISRNYDDLKFFLTPEQLKKLEEMRRKTLVRIQGKMQEKL
jgi:Spy/CpxP family protein refolding chaperone